MLPPTRLTAGEVEFLVVSVWRRCFSVGLEMCFRLVVETRLRVKVLVVLLFWTRDDHLDGLRGQ